MAEDVLILLYYGFLVSCGSDRSMTKEYLLCFFAYLTKLAQRATAMKAKTATMVFAAEKPYA